MSSEQLVLARARLVECRQRLEESKRQPVVRAGEFLYWCVQVDDWMRLVVQLESDLEKFGDV